MWVTLYLTSLNTISNSNNVLYFHLFINCYSYRILSTSCGESKQRNKGRDSQSHTIQLTQTHWSEVIDEAVV